MLKKIIVLLLLFTLPLFAEPVKSKKVSLFREKIWQDIDGQKKSMASIIDDYALVVLSYTECTTLCPTITSTMKSVTEKLEASQLHPKVIFISINNAGDSLKDRKKHFQKFSLDSKFWHFLKAPHKKTEYVALSLGFSFGEKSNNEHIMHSSKLAIVNHKGQVLKDIDLLSQELEEITNQIQSTINPAKP
jgi:protein SCO1